MAKKRVGARPVQNIIRIQGPPPRLTVLEARRLFLGQDITVDKKGFINAEGIKTRFRLAK